MRFKNSQVGASRLTDLLYELETIMARMLINIKVSRPPKSRASPLKKYHILDDISVLLLRPVRCAMSDLCSITIILDYSEIYIHLYGDSEAIAPLTAYLKLSCLVK